MQSLQKPLKQTLKPRQRCSTHSFWGSGRRKKYQQTGMRATLSNYQRKVTSAIARTIVESPFFQHQQKSSTGCFWSGWSAVDPLLSDQQGGFCQNRSCIDQIATICIIVEQSLEWNTPLYVNIVDYEKAFDSVDRDTLWKLLCDYRQRKRK